MRAIQFTTLLNRLLMPVLGISLLLGGLVGLSGCGFQMRGYDLQLPFEKIRIEGNFGTANEITNALRDQPRIKVVEKAIDAQVVLIVMSQNIERTVLAFNSAGRAREIQLRMRVMYRITDGYSIELMPPQEIMQTRDISVSEAEVLSMPATEAFMQNDMQRDIGLQLIRRLRAVKLPTG